MSHRIRRSLLNLGALEIVNYLIPLALVPFITRRLGLAAYGMIAVALNLIHVAYIFVDMGTDQVAPREIAIARGARDVERGVFSSVVVIRFSALLCVLLVAIGTARVLRVDPGVLVASVTILVFRATLIDWYFQGLERMSVITISNAAGRTVYAIAVILVLQFRTNVQVSAVLWAYAVGYGLTLSVQGIIYVKHRGVHPNTVDGKAIRQLLSSAKIVLMSNISSRLYSASFVIVSSAIFGSTVAGVIALADRVLVIYRRMLSPINRALLPFVSVHPKQGDFLRQYRRVFRIGIVISVGVGLCVFFAAPMILSLLGGPDASSFDWVLRSMSPMFVASAGYILLGNHILIPLRMEKVLLRSVWIPTGVYLLVGMPLSATLVSLPLFLFFVVAAEFGIFVIRWHGVGRRWRLQE